MSGADGDGRKQAYFNKLTSLLDEYNKIMIVNVDNIGSRHLQKIRKATRGKAIILMGKNTMMRKAIRGHIQNVPQLEVLLPQVKYNVGFVFVKEDLAGTKKILAQEKVSAPARIGATAPNDVVIPAGPTGLEPTQTTFLQALNIASRIAKGTIEIVNDVKLIKAGEKVTSSQAALLQKLNINPFSYGLGIINIYDNGTMYSPAVLDLSDDDILEKFHSGVRNVACVSLAAGIPTVASLPHSIVRGYKNVLAVALATDVLFPQAEKLKDILANPGASAAPAATTAAPATGGKAEAKAPEPAEPEEEEDVGMGDLFG